MQSSETLNPSVAVTSSIRTVKKRTQLLSISLTEGRALFLIIATTLLVYANSLGGEFVYDDIQQIIGNPEIHSWSNILRAFQAPVWNFQRWMIPSQSFAPYYRPLFTIYLTIGYQIFGLWEPGWHLLNTFVHTGATVGVYYLLRRLSGQWRLAAVAALLFGVHPVHVESIAWISGLTDPLAALFYIPAMLCYARFREERNRKWLALSVFAYAGSVFSKEATLVLPAIIAVWDLLRNSQAGLTANLRRITRLMIPYAFVALIYLVARQALLINLGWVNPTKSDTPDVVLWMTTPYVTVYYLKLLLAPLNLSLAYDIPLVRSAASPLFLLPALLLVGLTFVLFALRRGFSQATCVALLLLIVPLLPVLYLKFFNSTYIVQDRYLYLPSIGFCYIVASVISLIGRHRTWLASLLFLTIFGSYSAITILQNRVWNNSLSLWSRAAKQAPTHGALNERVGVAYAEIGDYEAARTQFAEAIAKDPTGISFYVNLAHMQQNLHDIEGSVETLSKALVLDTCLIKNYDPKKHAKQLLPVHNELGILLLERGEFARAREQFTEVMRLQPSSQTHLNLSRATYGTGDHKLAISELESLLAENPNYDEARSYLDRAITEIYHHAKSSPKAR